MPEEGNIIIRGAKVNNLKDITVEIPRNKFVVVTGISGSGKSSLAFDTLFAEGQRRFAESLSSYARQFLGRMSKPDVESIEGIPPAIAIEQKVNIKNPRSTVATTTEIYDYLRLLYARAGEAYSYLSGEKMVRYTEEQIIDLILKEYKGRKVLLLAPVVKSRKGHYKELFETIRRKGYLSVRVDGQIREIVPGMKLDRYKNHDVEIVVDKLIPQEKDDERLRKSLSTAMAQGEGIIQLLDVETDKLHFYSKHLMCPVTGISYREPAPHSFSFNSPQGSCPKCKGLGRVSQIDVAKVFPNPELSIAQGGIEPLGKYKSSMIFWQIEALLDRYDMDLNTPVGDFPEELIDDLIDGSDERIKIKASTMHSSNDYFTTYDGLAKYMDSMVEAAASEKAQKWAEQFSRTTECPVCHGARLNREALHFRMWDKNIYELSNMDISELSKWMGEVENHLSERQLKISTEIIKEIRTRLKFLMDVGLDYLNLNRSSASLSGGESQRIRLATQIGSKLVNVLYILDEPSIGLHQRDNMRLIKSLKELRDLGNTVLVVEHDKDMMLNADYVVDIGPMAGRKGGQIVFAGTPEEMLKTNTLTSQYLNGGLKITIPETRRPGNGHALKLFGCKGNNLKNIDVSFPLNKLIIVTGVSGSGKSTLVNETLQPILSQHFYRSLKDPMPYDRIEGLEFVDKVVDVDQAPLGRTPRSNPATYTGVFSDIRNLYVGLPEAKMRGYKPGRFSFNVGGGRCEECGGNGYKNIVMNFLPDVLVPCEVCHGKRYNRETLEVRFRGKSIADVLDMTINQAVEFFENVPNILNKIKVLQDVGLGYIKLGQPSTTLSGGESQRVKLATELSKKDTGKTVYILDEPTTGLHFEDIRVLLNVLERLVDKGNTVIVIEHNMDVIKMADHIIDMGPDGGAQGGKILFEGTPEDLAKKRIGYTASFLKQELKH